MSFSMTNKQGAITIQDVINGVLGDLAPPTQPTHNNSPSPTAAALDALNNLKNSTGNAMANALEQISKVIYEDDEVRVSEIDADQFFAAAGMTVTDTLDAPDDDEDDDYDDDGEPGVFITLPEFADFAEQMANLKRTIVPFEEFNNDVSQTLQFIDSQNLGKQEQTILDIGKNIIGANEAVVAELSKILTSMIHITTPLFQAMSEVIDDLHVQTPTGPLHDDDEAMMPW